MLLSGPVNPARKPIFTSALADPVAMGMTTINVKNNKRLR
jgi:hypothetical protein